jgi:hypothetical protein
VSAAIFRATDGPGGVTALALRGAGLALALRASAVRYQAVDDLTRLAGPIPELIRRFPMTAAETTGVVTVSGAGAALQHLVTRDPQLVDVAVSTPRRPAHRPGYASRRSGTCPAVPGRARRRRQAGRRRRRRRARPTTFPSRPLERGRPPESRSGGRDRCAPPDPVRSARSAAARGRRYPRHEVLVSRRP